MTGAEVRRYRLRACAAVTTTSWRTEIVEFGRVDLETQGDKIVRCDPPMSALYKPAGYLPPPDDIAGITAGDLLKRPICGWDKLKGAIWQPMPPDVLVAHGANKMRMLLPATTHLPLPWACSYKIARQLWPAAPGFTLDDLMQWRGLRDGSDPAAHHDRAAARARDVAALLADMARDVTLSEMLRMSAVVTAPLSPPPLHDDDIGWRVVPDDDLRWLARDDVNLPAEIRARASKEQARRVATGAAKDIGFDPWVLPE